MISPDKWNNGQPPKLERGMEIETKHGVFLVNESSDGITAWVDDTFRCNITEVLRWRWSGPAFAAGYKKGWADREIDIIALTAIYGASQNV